MKKFLGLVLGLCLVLSVTLAYGEDYVLTFNNTTKTQKAVSYLPFALGGTNSTTQNFVDLTTNQTINGTKQFGTIPLLPASDPTTDNQAVRKLYSDTKISKTTAGEIAAMTEKTTLVDNDLFLIEDSEASNAKKKIKKSNISSPDTNTSNVVFEWYGVETSPDSYVSLVSHVANFTTTASSPGYIYFSGWTSTAQTILIGKFKKISGISTITIQTRLWSQSALAGNEAKLNVNIGGQSNIVQSSALAPTWATPADIDVSNLTNGTTYDITIELYNTNNDHFYSFCSAVVLIAS